MESGAGSVDHDGVMVDLAELDSDHVLDALNQTCRAERRAAAWKLQLAAHWADLYSGDALDQNTSALPGTERPRQLGGDGTPTIGEFAAGEFAAVAGLSPSAGSRLIAAALDLRHRFPTIWDRVRRCEVEVWICTKIATDTRHLSLEAARRADAAIAPFLTSLPPGRLFTLVEAKLIEADPETAEARARIAQADRYVRRGRSNTLGVMPVSARGLAGDVLQFTAACDKIATILAWKGDPDTADVRRSKALGYVANPLRHAQLLAEYQDRDAHAPDSDRGSSDQGPKAVSGQGSKEVSGQTQPAVDRYDEPMLIFESDLHPADCEDTEPEPSPGPVDSVDHPRIDDPPAIDYAGALQTLFEQHQVSPRDLLPKTTVYLHLDRDTLLSGSGVVRAEEIGPITPGQFTHWIRGANLTITPVIDPDNTPAVDSYQTTDRLKDALRMINPTEAFPYGTNTNRDIDHDHAIPYRPPPDGPPGQTSIHTLHRLGRRSHRLKTHAGWQVRIPEPGTTIWRSPHGWHFLNNPAGTHPLGKNAYAERLWHAAEGTITGDLYPPPPDTRVQLAG
jgi:hypothetical protein